MRYFTIGLFIATVSRYGARHGYSTTALCVQRAALMSEGGKLFLLVKQSGDSVEIAMYVAPHRLHH